MKRTFLFSGLLAFALLLISSCTKDDLTNPLENSINEFDQETIASDRAPIVPFKGSYTTYPTANPNDFPPDLTCDILFNDPVAIFYIPAEGNASHLGNSEWIALSAIVPIEGTFIPNNEFEPPGFTESYYQNGCQTFVAANGATLEGEICGQSTISYIIIEGVGAVPVSGGGCGNYILDDGSGRFANTTGYGTYEFSIQLLDDELVGQLEFEGVLDKRGNEYVINECPSCDDIDDEDDYDEDDDDDDEE